MQKGNETLKFTIVFVAFVASLLLVAFWIRAEIVAYFEFQRTIGSYWDLSEKASSLDSKADYLDKYVAGITAAELSGNNAILFPTPNNSYEQNMIALKSLQKRMAEIRGMDVQSFAYQQAITQITAQEQGEAGSLTDTFNGLWYLKHHRPLWDWIDVIAWSLMATFVIASGAVTLVMSED